MVFPLAPSLFHALSDLSSCELAVLLISPPFNPLSRSFVPDASSAVQFLHLEDFSDNQYCVFAILDMWLRLIRSLRLLESIVPYFAMSLL